MNLPPLPPPLKKRKPARKLHTVLTPKLATELCAVAEETADLFVMAGRTQTSVYHLREWIASGSRGGSELEIQLYNAFMLTLADSRAKMIRKAMLAKTDVPWKALQHMTPDFGEIESAPDTRAWIASLDAAGRAELREALALHEDADLPSTTPPARRLSSAEPDPE